MLRDTVRRFMDAHVHPVEEKLDHDTVGLPREQLVALQAKARRPDCGHCRRPRSTAAPGSVSSAKWWSPRRQRNAGWGLLSGPGAFGGNPNIMFKATPEQFEKYARPVIDGIMSKAYTAITEASGGSDPARAIKLKATRDGSSYLLNGSKMWISHAPDADWGWCMPAPVRAPWYLGFHSRKGHPRSHVQPDPRDGVLRPLRTALR